MLVLALACVAALAQAQLSGGPDMTALEQELVAKHGGLVTEDTRLRQAAPAPTISLSDALAAS